MMDRSCKSHGEQWSLSGAKFRAVVSKPTLFIAKFRRTFVSKRKFDETALFVQRTICAKSLELSFARNFEESSREQKTKFGISLALLLHNTVDNNSMCSVCHTFLIIEAFKPLRPLFLRMFSYLKEKFLFGSLWE